MITTAREPVRRSGHLAHLSLDRRLALVLGSGALVLMVMMGVLVYSLLELHDRRSAVLDRLDPAALAVADLRAAMLDQETGVRGYVLSGDRAFLAPYFSGQSDGDAAIAQLDDLLGGGSGAELDAVRAEVGRWREEYATRVVQSTDATAGPGVTESFLDESRSAFDTVRAALAQLESDIGAQRSAAQDTAGAAYRQVWVVTALTAAILVALAVAGLVGLRRSVTRPLDALAGRVRTVAGGDLRSPVHGTGPPELVGLGDDIEAMRLRILDELDRLEEARTAISQQALELERSNADLEQFAYVASHDLQEPLRKIAGFCQLLERRYKGQLDDKADQYIAFVVDGAKRMQDLINDLLAFSRVGRTTERFVPVDLVAAADTALVNLGSVPEEAGASIDIGPLPTVDGDPRLLAALFQNLIGNAVKFRGDDPPRVVVRSHDLDDATAEITVADNGIGISPDYAEQIFTLFQRLHNKSQYEGTGIGLALCKKIVEFHGGSIGLDTDAAGPGATFRITLPRHGKVAEPVVPEDHGATSDGGTTDDPADAADRPDEVLLP